MSLRDIFETHLASVAERLNVIAGEHRISANRQEVRSLLNPEESSDDLDTSASVVVSFGCGELHGVAMHGGTIEIARTPENLDLIASLLSYPEDSQLHTHVLVSSDRAQYTVVDDPVPAVPASENARETTFSRLVNRRFEALANQAIAETHKLQERCRGCQNRNRDFDGHVSSDHVRDLKCAINPVYATDGVGECADFQADEPVAQQGQCKSLAVQTLIDKLQAIPGVYEIQVQAFAHLPAGWTYTLKVKRSGMPDQPFGFWDYEISHPRFLEHVEWIVRRVSEGDRS